MVDYSVLEIRKLDGSLTEPLADFFRILRAVGDEKIFHPHKLTDEEASQRTLYRGKDLYYAMVRGREILGYGVLRGWDEGYTVPSLGIAIRPSARDKGLGELMVRFLHAAAIQRGANRVRLKIYPNNTKALKLYKKLGYTFQGEEAGQMVGYIDL